MKSKYIEKIKNIDYVANRLYTEELLGLTESEIVLDALSVAKTHYENLVLAVPQEMESSWISPNIPPADGDKVIVKGSRGAQTICNYRNGQFYDAGRNRVRKGVKGYVHVPE